MYDGDTSSGATKQRGGRDQPTESSKDISEELAIQVACMDDMVEGEKDEVEEEIVLVRRRRRSRIEEDLIDLAPSRGVVKLQGLDVSPFDVFLEEVIPENMLSELPDVHVVDVSVCRMGEPPASPRPLATPPCHPQIEGEGGNML